MSAEEPSPAPKEPPARWGWLRHATVAVAMIATVAYMLRGQHLEYGILAAIACAILARLLIVDPSRSAP